MTRPEQRSLMADSKTREAVDMICKLGDMSQIQLTRELIAICGDKRKAAYMRNHMMKIGFLEKRVTMHATDLARTVKRKRK